jgi:hypothetical protein
MAATKQQIPVGSAKAVPSGFYGPSTWANVMYFDIGDLDGHTPGEVIATVVQAVHEFYVACHLDDISDQWSHSFTTVTYRDAEDSIVRVRVADAQLGTDDNADQDAQVAYLINWSTGDPRRGGKPRQYIAGVPTNKMADVARVGGAVVTAVTASLITWLESLPTPAGARVVPLQMVEMSFRDSLAWRDTPVSFPIIGAALNPVVASQRRRVNRLRPH